MRIAIDAYNIALEHGTGVATYGRSLARNSSALGHDIHVLFGTRQRHSNNRLLNEIGLAEQNAYPKRPSAVGKIRQALYALKGGVVPLSPRAIPLSGKVILPSSLQLACEGVWNVRELYSNAQGLFRATGAFTKVHLPEVELFHWTYPLPIRCTKRLNIYTLHDLVPLKLPYAAADHKNSYYHLCRRIAREADHIVTVSENSRRDLIEMLRVDEYRVTNLWQSTDIADSLEGIDESTISRYVEGLLGAGFRNYFLFFGAIEPKKNIARLLEAYLSSASTGPLVIVGAPGWGSRKDTKLLKTLTALDSDRRIIWLGYLPRAMLTMLIAGAKATVFPSLYEGFGLPVLESMALGTPVITSNLSSLPEVAGDAGLLVDPYDVGSISKAITTLDQDVDLGAALSALGRSQALKFSSSAYAERLSEFYSRFQ